MSTTELHKEILDVLKEHHPLRDTGTEQVVCWCLWAPEIRLYGFEEWDVVWGHVVSEVIKALRPMLALPTRLTSYADEMERFGPTFGPVDETGRPDPEGEMMVDMSMESLVYELRALMKPIPERKPRRPRRIVDE